ncbi:hypothetical protein E2C01_043032 [Portunus trituberculatus]|uniref:Uncharacterized protein n=1 Tax=Portunus trituberculatus TaxID=210409 RepID=A0A5B7FV75_PORTR|nr:hypothetical protein [Portunus trituberculatus]
MFPRPSGHHASRMPLHPGASCACLTGVRRGEYRAAVNRRDCECVSDHPPKRSSSRHLRHATAPRPRPAPVHLSPPITPIAPPTHHHPHHPPAMGLIRFVAA